MRRKFENSDDDYFFNEEITGGPKKNKTSESKDTNNLPDPEDDPEFYEDLTSESCWMFDTISTIMAMDKPFGMLFSMPKIEKFLKARGYEIVDKYFSHLKDTMKLAVKKEEVDIDSLPDTTETASTYHIRGVFTSEIQDILLKWLLKVGK